MWLNSFSIVVLSLFRRRCRAFGPVGGQRVDGRANRGQVVPACVAGGLRWGRRRSPPCSCWRSSPVLPFSPLNS